MKHTTTRYDTTLFQPHEGALNHGPIVIVGAGLAGLFTALKLAPMPVVVVSAAPLGTGAASAWAQGGIAAAVGDGDTVDEHAHDTVAAGAGLVNDAVARMVAREAPSRVMDLRDFGVPFDRDCDGAFVLSREAAHSANRIVRVSGDKAGAAIMQSVVAKVRATKSIRVIEGYELGDLVTRNGRVIGIRIAHDDTHGLTHYEIVPAAAVVLATGGIGALYDVTTNPSFALGSSLGIAGRAGAVISDAEFVQFHPTALDFGLDPAPLATESLRGEGAVLVDKHGERFMQALHKDGELAPRDIVARGVFEQNMSGEGAYLDCRDAIGLEFAAKFPTVYASCRNAGFDPVTQPLPVVTAAHYHMGGIATDSRGRTSVSGLWAIGEVAATGLHGANRLASNSLLETLVFGARAAKDIASLAATGDATLEFSGLRQVLGSANVDRESRSRSLKTLRAIMSRNVGVIRDEPSLGRAIEALRGLDHTNDVVVRNAVLAARFIATSALMREESRGAQYRSDFPDTKPDGLRSFVTLSDIDALNVVPPQPTAAKRDPIEVTAAPAA